MIDSVLGKVLETISGIPSHVREAFARGKFLLKSSRRKGDRRPALPERHIPLRTRKADEAGRDRRSHGTRGIEMVPDLSHEVTNLLMRLNLGDTAASDRLFQIVYGELRRLAGSYMARES